MYNPEFTSILRFIAERFYWLGFNITVIRNNGKWPCHKWEPFQYRRQTEQEAFHHPWVYATGIGTITGGYDNYYCLDFDQCSIELIPYYHSRLGLPENYNWTVLSGSGNGFHIWFRCNDLSANSNSKVIIYKPELPGTFKQVELRLNAHVVLPPSKHSSGNHYKFYSKNNLTQQPKQICYGNIINTF